MLSYLSSILHLLQELCLIILYRDLSLSKQTTYLSPKDKYLGLSEGEGCCQRLLKILRLFSKESMSKRITKKNRN